MCLTFRLTVHWQSGHLLIWSFVAVLWCCVMILGGQMKAHAEGVFITFLGSLIVLEKLKDFVCNISVWGTKCVCSNDSSGVKYLWLASMCEGFTA